MKLETAPTTVFQEMLVLDGARLAGWAALVHGLGIAALVRQPSCVSEQYVSGSRRQEGPWTVFDKRYALWKEVHKAFYDQVPVIRHPDIFGLNVMSKHVKGTAGMMRPFFWNVWLDK